MFGPGLLSLDFGHAKLDHFIYLIKFMTIFILKKTYLNLILIKTLHMIFVCLKNLGSGSIKRKSLIRINMSRIRLYAHAESLLARQLELEKHTSWAHGICVCHRHRVICFINACRVTCHLFLRHHCRSAVKRHHFSYAP